MLATLLWSLGGLATAGGGLWVAALFVPTVAGLLKATLDFLRSPVGTLVVVGALGLFLFTSGWVGGDIHGTSTTRAAWRVADDAKARAEASRVLALRLTMQSTASAALAADDAFTKSIDEK